MSGCLATNLFGRDDAQTPILEGLSRDSYASGSNLIDNPSDEICAHCYAPGKLYGPDGLCSWCFADAQGPEDELFFHPNGCVGVVSAVNHEETQRV